MDKLYDRIIWENDTTPALNEDNLNAMSKAIDDIDDRVLDLGAGVLEVIPEIESLVENAEQIIEDTKGYAESAEESAQTATGAAADASNDELDAEAWAVGQRNGQDVPPTDPTYHNNAKYWAGQSGTSTLSSMADVDIINPVTGQVIEYNTTSSKWENKTMYTVLTATLAIGQTTLTFTDASITNTSFIDIGTSVYTAAPINAVQNGTTATLTFDPQDVAVDVMLKVWN